MTRRVSALAPVALLVLASLAPAAGPASLQVTGEVAKPLELTAETLATMPRHTVRVKDHDGRMAEYQGVPLVEVLKAAGLKFGQDLRGPALALYLVVEASDGYRAVFALPELDPACTDLLVLLADRYDGQPLDAKEGPFRIVVVGEKRHARWVRQVVSLRIGRA
jgi:DMSO/TMAO reductase YedYZ molybdopterin-dependent catalytic subunit